MSAIDKDRGLGDTSMFSASDLERLYRVSGIDPTERIQGSSLNKMLKVSDYEPTTWYRITSQGVIEKLDA